MGNSLFNKERKSEYKELLKLHPHIIGTLLSDKIEQLNQILNENRLHPHIIGTSLSDSAKIDCPKEYFKLHPHIIGNSLADATTILYVGIDVSL